MKLLAAIDKMWKCVSALAPIRTIWFNIHYLPFADAIKCPVLVYRHTKLVLPKGAMFITAPVHAGMIKLGHYVPGTQDERYSQTTWEVIGEVVFRGRACIGRGTNISVGNKAKLELGDCLTVSGNTEIYCHNRITIGDMCTLSWGILMMDTDFHKITDFHFGQLLNASQPVKVGNHVWIGCRAIVLKGVSIPNNTIIAAGSLITRMFDKENCVIGGHGQEVNVLRENVRWIN